MTDLAPMQKGSAAIPEADHRMPPTSKEKIDAALEVLREHAGEWVGMGIDERITLLETLTKSTLDVSERWIAAALEAKGISRGTAAEAEEWLAGPVVVLRNLQLLKRTLEDIRDHGSPRLPGRVTTRPDGQVVAPVFPTDGWDKLLFTGFTAEVWMDPAVTPSTLPETMGVFYRNAPGKGNVALVLGAGNVSSIGPMDALYKLFAEGQVVVLKMNPVNEYLGPIFDEAFRELHRRGYFRVVYGGAEEGEYLCQHGAVDDIHITGSDKTHDAIVYGVGDEGRKRKEKREPRLSKPISSELGNVSPIIVVPGPWSQDDLAYQGVNLASSLTNNAGFNCNATRVIVTHQAWKQRAALLDAVKEALRKAPPRKPYYPGAAQRHEAFVEAHPKAHQFGPQGEGQVPWTFITDLDPSQPDDICFTTEAFCGVTSEVPLTAASTVEFIENAVSFCNDELWGTLNAAIIVHPASLKDPAVAEALERAIANLRYGAVAVNHWPALAYALVSPTWGAFPGHEMHDIRSGRGVVHNTYLFDRPQKSVVRGPFRVMPKPAWFVTNKTSHEVGRKLASFNAEPSPTKIPSILWSALRG